MSMYGETLSVWQWCHIQVIVCVCVCLCVCVSMCEHDRYLLVYIYIIDIYKIFLVLDYHMFIYMFLCISILYILLLGKETLPLPPLTTIGEWPRRLLEIYFGISCDNLITVVVCAMNCNQTARKSKYRYSNKSTSLCWSLMCMNRLAPLCN